MCNFLGLPRFFGPIMSACSDHICLVNNCASEKHIPHIGQNVSLIPFSLLETKKKHSIIAI